MLPEGEVVGAGEGETGFDFFGEGAEVAVVEGDSVPAADDGRAGLGAQALLSRGAVGHADGADELGLDDFPGVGGGSDQVEAVEGGGVGALVVPSGRASVLSEGVVEGLGEVGELAVGEGFLDLADDLFDSLQGDGSLAEEVDDVGELLGEEELRLAEVVLDLAISTLPSCRPWISSRTWSR